MRRTVKQYDEVQERGFCDRDASLPMRHIDSSATLSQLALLGSEHGVHGGGDVKVRSDISGE